MKYDNAIKDKVYVTATAYIDRTFDAKTKKVTSENRVISFRDQSYAVDTKSRFTEIAPKINFNTDEFIKALEDAIQAQIRIQAGMTLTEAQISEMKEVEAKAAVVTPKVPTRDENIKYLTDNFAAMDMDLRTDVMATLNASGVKKFTDATDEVLKELAAKVRAKLG